MQVNLYPTKCNLCHGKVIYISNAKIYGRQYGSGYCYYCTECGAYVGTHKPLPKKALGILANKEMMGWKIKCHELFDSFWKKESFTKKQQQTERASCYRRLAIELKIQPRDCHFGYFNLRELKDAYEVLLKW